MTDPGAAPDTGPRTGPGTGPQIGKLPGDKQRVPLGDRTLMRIVMSGTERHEGCEFSKLWL